MINESAASRFLYVFNRQEVKYMLNETQHTKFLNRIEPYMMADAYGLSTICNVYYDTENFAMIRNSIEKPVFKEKLRLRSYGTPKSPESAVFIEIKRKWQSTVYKRRVSMPFCEAENYLSGGPYPDKYDSQIMREIDYMVKLYKIVPKTYIAYDRIAYAGRTDDLLRMTFDTNIRSRKNDLSLSGGSDGEMLINPADKLCLLEIKVPDAMPLWMTDILSDLKIYPTSFSKYGEAYKKFLIMSHRAVTAAPDGKLIYKGVFCNV